MKELLFTLDIDDDWPPISVEGVPCTQLAVGYQIDVAPLFVKDLSVGDVIAVVFDTDGNVSSWNHITQSNRSTIWLLRVAKTNDIESILKELRSFDCNTVQLPKLGSYSIDVPSECSIQVVDKCLAKLNESCVAIAYPSFRHPE